MSLDKLTIIFFIIVLPIVVVLNAYTGAQIDTLNLQISYDDKLKNSTYDAVKAFQLNTVNSSTSDLANSKIRDIEASVNVFFSSMSSNFNISGYNTNTLQEYVPALVYTMYDGYYIYSPYSNKLPENTYQITKADGSTIDSDDNASYKYNEKLYGLKPYIYYSCQYQREDKDDDFVITYSLDNYITIQGKVNGKWVNDSGYLISNIKKNEDSIIKYRGIQIEKENILKDYVMDDDGKINQYPYQKINGVKYYYDENASDNERWFTIENGHKLKQIGYKFDNEYDSSAYDYYNEAFEFKDRIIKEYGLKDLTSHDARDKRFKNDIEYKIFDFDNNIEEPNSDFNQHRLAVIRYTIEKNLSVAINNYNNYSNVQTDFRMPELKEDEWDKILNNISVISFMQGLSIGGKVYNGYAIVSNNNNEEVVNESSIYIACGNDQTYHNVLEEGLEDKVKDPSSYVGILNMDLLRRTKDTNSGTMYYYPKLYYADYNSVVYQTNVVNTEEYGNIYKYLDNNNRPNLAKLYYTALGRERQSTYKVNKNIQDLLKLEE